MDSTEKNQKKRKKKKGAVIWVLLLVIVGAAAFVLTRHPDILAGGGHVVTGSGGAYDRFYEPVFGISLEESEKYDEYLELDRYIHYKNGSVSVALTGGEADPPGEEVRFFTDYFNAVISGDSDAYNSMFTKDYLESHGEKSAFTPQMIYDIQVERVSTGGTSSAFDVSYKIFRNNGTFRNDIYSDASRTVRIVIDDSEGKYKISDLKYFVS